MAAAAKASARLCAPGMASARSTSAPEGRCTRPRAQPCTSKTASQQRASQEASQPKVSARTPRGTATSSRIQGVKSSEPHSMTQLGYSPAAPVGGRASTISALARAMLARLPSRPMWATPTLVMTPMCGRAMAAIRAISPAAFMPISTTRASVSRGADSTVSGAPIVELRLPRVAWVRKRRASTAATISFVVVLPEEPVTPTTTQSSWSRHHEARRARNSSPSAMTSRAAPAARAASTRASSGSRVPATAPAPAARAAGAKSLPSTRSPGKATNRPPCATARESTATSDISRSTGPHTRRAPVA